MWPRMKATQEYQRDMEARASDVLAEELAVRIGELNVEIRRLRAELAEITRVQFDESM